MTAPTPRPWATIPLPEWNPFSLLPGYAEAKAKAERGESLFPVRPKGRPWTKRSLASLQAEHDELVALRDRLAVTTDDTAAAMLSLRDARRETSRMDRDLAKFTLLTQRIDFLAYRIRGYSPRSPSSSPSTSPGRSVVGASLPARRAGTGRDRSSEVSPPATLAMIPVPQPSDGFPPGP